MAGGKEPPSILRQIDRRLNGLHNSMMDLAAVVKTLGEGLERVVDIVVKEPQGAEKGSKGTSEDGD